MSPRTLDELERTYRFTIHEDLRRFRFAPLWATGTLGVAHLGEPGAGVWRARSRDGLVVKVRRWAKRDALRRGHRDPIIEVVEEYA